MEKFVCQLSMLLVLIGALNWGLIGVNNYNAVDKLTALVTKDNKTANNVIYMLVGLAACVLIYKKLVAKHVKKTV